jgi:hypothetical protein
MRGETDHVHHVTAPSQIFKPSFDPIKVEQNTVFPHIVSSLEQFPLLE